jgi:hypothetical protein
MIGLHSSVPTINPGMIDSLPASLAKIPHQRHTAIRSGICVNAEISSDFEIRSRDKQVV